MLSLIKLKPKRFGDRKLEGLKRDSQLPYLITFKGVIFMKKIFLIVILIFFVSLSTVRVYGYYEDSTVSYISENKATIKIVEKMSSNNGKDLVPTGAILGIGDTEEIVFTYKVFIQDGINFEYYIENITINGEILDQDTSSIFNFSFEIKLLEDENILTNLFGEKIEGNYYEIEVTLSMDFPTEERYYEIAGQQLKFEFFIQNEL